MQLTEIRWHARAGQGAVTAAKVVAETALSADQYMQAMPEYGPERMGAPIKAFTRISDEPIEIHNNIENPDVVIVLDETLLDVVDVTEGLKPDGVLIINTCSPAADVKKALGLADTRARRVPSTPPESRWTPSSATSRTRRSSVRSSRSPASSTSRSFKGLLAKNLGKKFGQEMIDANFAAVDAGVRGGDRGMSEVGRLRHRRVDERASSRAARPFPSRGNSDDYVTGGWRSERPYRDDEKCTQCLLCWVFCPDTSVLVEGREGRTTSTYEHCKGCGICAHECPFDAIEMVPEGCELPGVK